MALSQARKPKVQPACLGSLRSLMLFPVPGWERGRETAEDRRGPQRNSAVNLLCDYWDLCGYKKNVQAPRARSLRWPRPPQSSPQGTQERKERKDSRGLPHLHGPGVRACREKANPGGAPCLTVARFSCAHGLGVTAPSPGKRSPRGVVPARERNDFGKKCNLA